MNTGKEEAEDQADIVVKSKHYEPFQLFSSGLGEALFDLVCSLICQFLDPRGYKVYNLSPDKSWRTEVRHSQSELGAMIVLNTRCAARIPENGVIWQYAFAHLFSPWCFLQFPALDETKNSYEFIFGRNEYSSINKISKADAEISKADAVDFLGSIRSLLIHVCRRFPRDSGGDKCLTSCSCGATLQGNLLPMLQDLSYKYRKNGATGSTDLIKTIQGFERAPINFSLNCSNENCALDLSVDVKSKGQFSCSAFNHDENIEEGEGESEVGDFLVCNSCKRINCGSCRTICTRVPNIIHEENICLECAQTCDLCTESVCQSHINFCEECDTSFCTTCRKHDYCECCSKTYCENCNKNVRWLDAKNAHGLYSECDRCEGEKKWQ